MKLKGEITSMECVNGKTGEAFVVVTLETGSAFRMQTAKSEFALEDQVTVEVTKDEPAPPADPE